MYVILLLLPAVTLNNQLLVGLRGVSSKGSIRRVSNTILVAASLISCRPFALGRGSIRLVVRLSATALSTPHPPNMTCNELLIAVIGVTGAGKTTFISTATGRTDLKIGRSIESCTCFIARLLYAC